MLKQLIFILLLALFAIPRPASADAIILKDGRRIPADLVWEDGNQVKCNIYGGTITYPKDQVAKIIIDKKAPPQQVEESDKNSVKPGDDINDIGIFYEPLDEDKAYSLYEEAIKDKQNNEFDIAQRKLEIVVNCLPKGSEYMDTVKEELYYNLPMAKAQWYLMNNQPMKAQNSLEGVTDYVKSRSDRFELLQKVDQMYTAINFQKIAYCSKVEMEAKNVYVALMNYFDSSVNTDMPTISELEKYNGGRGWTNNVKLSGNPNSTMTISITDNNSCCNKGKIYEYEMPSGIGRWK